MARAAGSSRRDKSHTGRLSHRSRTRNASRSPGSLQADHEAFPGGGWTFPVWTRVSKQPRGPCCRRSAERSRAERQRLKQQEPRLAKESAREENEQRVSRIRRAWVQSLELQLSSRRPGGPQA
jgi:hypothetical protein